MSPYTGILKKSNQWLQPKGETVIIAGPCGAEKREQVIQTAEGLKDCGLTFFRTGVWKPRTRPDSFEGAGSIALKWLKEVREKYQMPVLVEVANAKHVDEVLKEGIDAVWIGARTTVNPFSVQEIADALKGTEIPVFIKNPVHPDIGLWLGAVERILKNGNGKVAAIHRGFHSETKTKYRNQPIWGMPIALREMLPDIPLICDPSHICGRKETIKEVAQTALDLGFNGLMLEAHPNPKTALSDAEQQLLPIELAELLKELAYRQNTSNNQSFNDELFQLRKLIDEIDEEILASIRRRHNVIEKIGNYKRANNVTVFQLERWKEILRSRSDWANSLSLNKDFADKLCRLLHDESIRIQTDENTPGDLKK